MQRDCQLMDNGDVYEILRDGTIHKVGNIKAHSTTRYVTNPMDETLKKWIWGISIVCGIGIIALIIALVNVNEDLDYARNQWFHFSDLYKEEQNANQTSSSENKRLKKFKKSVTSTYPIIITDIKIGNSYYGGDLETGYGSTIYSYNTMYLKPKIYYTGLKSCSPYLKIKWYKPSGELSTGSSSPYGFSQGSSYSVSEGQHELALSGWGGTDRGHWSSGTYRIEVWYNDICLKSKTFTIY